MSDHVVSASHGNTISFSFYLSFCAVHEICRILLRNHISVASSFSHILPVLKLSKPHIRYPEGLNIGITLYISLFLVWMELEMHQFLRTYFILWKLIFMCAIFYEISVLILPLLDFKERKYLIWSLCLSSFPMIKPFLYLGHTLFRLTTNTFDVCCSFPINFCFRFLL